ncbi:hypothetical protein Slala05_51620 [Streptomyces lavendulae subsp. lavendulae]|nr:hypothetical protein Slala05_51620 [Streptomyces lavendulae subsp. lavendulae]
MPHIWLMLMAVAWNRPIRRVKPPFAGGDPDMGGSLGGWWFGRQDGAPQGLLRRSTGSRALKLGTFTYARQELRAWHVRMRRAAAG